MPSDETRQLAKVAAVTDRLDKELDKLFAIAAEIRILLTPPAPPAPPAPEEKRAEP
jgi:hypothetical protein